MVYVSTSERKLFRHLVTDRVIVLEADNKGLIPENLFENGTLINSSHVSLDQMTEGGWSEIEISPYLGFPPRSNKVEFLENYQKYLRQVKPELFSDQVMVHAIADIQNLLLGHEFSRELIDFANEAYELGDDLVLLRRWLKMPTIVTINTMVESIIAGIYPDLDRETKGYFMTDLWDLILSLSE